MLQRLSAAMLIQQSVEEDEATNGTKKLVKKAQADQVSSQIAYFCGYARECRENHGPHSLVRKLNMAMMHVDK